MGRHKKTEIERVRSIVFAHAVAFVAGIDEPDALEEHFEPGKRSGKWRGYFKGRKPSTRMLRKIMEKYPGIAFVAEFELWPALNPETPTEVLEDIVRKYWIYGDLALHDPQLAAQSLAGEVAWSDEALMRVARWPHYDALPILFALAQLAKRRQDDRTSEIVSRMAMERMQIETLFPPFKGARDALQKYLYQFCAPVPQGVAQTYSEALQVLEGARYPDWTVRRHLLISMGVSNHRQLMEDVAKLRGVSLRSELRQRYDRVASMARWPETAVIPDELIQRV